MQTGQSIRNEILPLLCSKIQSFISLLLSKDKDLERNLNEIRIRAGLPLCLVTAAGDLLLEDIVPQPSDIAKTLSLIADCSYYALEKEFANGYVTLPGGHRVGLCGRASFWDKETVSLRDVNGFCIRIAKEYKGAADEVLPYLVGEGGKIRSTLVISPPGCGKTTLLRDICRNVSTGNSRVGLLPAQVGVVDERSEIAALLGGIPQYDLGPRVDVLDRWPKAKGIIMLMRSMGPEVIVTDELGGEDDASAIGTALLGGVTILASCHGYDIKTVQNRPYSSWIVNKGFFRTAVILSRKKGPGTLEYVGPIRKKEAVF